MTHQDKSQKVVVFDMDETLGYFVQFGIFWESITAYIKSETTNEEPIVITQEDFNKIFDLYPEFKRPNILSILNYLKHKKQTNDCSSVMIYTNNQGPKEWAKSIKEYYESKINNKLFDQIINAFKVNGKQVEICRTTHDKTHKDFIRCSKIPVNTKICFLDDTYYPEMNNHNIFYIKLKPYVYNLSTDVLIQRFVSSNVGKSIIKNGNFEYFEGFVKNYIKNFDFIYVTKTSDDYEIDKIISKKTMVHLQKFFNKKNFQPTTKTNKEKKSNKRKTSKLGFYKLRK
jgi:hypothetical protein